MQKQNIDGQILINDLLSSIGDDTLTPSEISEKVLYMMKKQEIEKKYRDLIKQRKDGRQYYIYISRKQYNATTYDGLIKILFDLENSKAKSSLTDIFPEWMLWRRDYTSVSSKTLKEDTFNWNKYLKDKKVATTPLLDLTPKDFVQEFRLWTKDRQMTRKQFNNVRSLINNLYAYAIENEIVTYNPIKEISSRQFTFKPVNNSDDVFTIEEREILLKHLADNNDMYSLAIQLDFHLVARIGELLSLRWSDIKGNTIHIQGQLLTDFHMNDDLTFSSKEHVNVDHIKGNTEQGFRYQHLTKEALRILDEIGKQNPDGEFILMKDGKQLTYDTFNRRLKQYCNECGIKAYSSHKIRFCTASLLYVKGMPITDLQKLLGHTKVAMTMHYLRNVAPTQNTADIMETALG